MIPEELTLEELSVVHDPKDIPILEIIKGCSREELESFDVYKAKELRHYNETQVPWMEEDRYLLGLSVHHEPTEIEFLEDYVDKTNNALRFKAYYVMRHPHMVERKEGN